MNKYNFTKEWISGFTQSDGSFIISFEKRLKGIIIRPKPIFILSQSIKELEMFKVLHKFLGIGNIQLNRKEVTLVITSIEEIIRVIIPLFDNHPVRGKKLLTYQIFREVSIMMKNKKHLTLEGILQIIELSYFYE